MIVISHRGNIEGPNPLLENHPNQILKCLDKDFEVEIDVWFLDGWFLGHDEPQHKVDIAFLQKSKLWCHAKNIEALYNLRKNNINCFWHQKDDVTLTSTGFIWTYPGKKLTKNSICVMPELLDQDIKECHGVCTDYPLKYKELK